MFGGTGSATIEGGTGGGEFHGGTGGNNLLLGGLGASTLFGGGNGDQLFSLGTGHDLLVAGAGNETLMGLGSGADTFRAGSGNDLIIGGTGKNTIVGGSGHDTLTGGPASDDFTFIKGQAGGHALITDFTVGTDKLTLEGYGTHALADALKHATVSGGSTTIALADHTTITFENLVNLDTNKAGESNGKQRSYGTTTCDGLLAMRAAGVPADDERIARAQAWLKKNHLEERAPGFDIEPARIGNLNKGRITSRALWRRHPRASS